MHLYGLNPWDYNLFTVLVVDGFGEGIPVAWAVANREDATILVELLKSIKERTGSLQPRWFMSDDANQYFNAWKGVFGAKETSKLLCAWHVDQAWRTALNQHVRTQQARNEIYHQLRILLMENKEATFRQLYCNNSFLLWMQVKQHLANISKNITVIVQVSGPLTVELDL